MTVLDTHIFLWMILEPEQMPVHILNTIEREVVLGLSAISLWETAMLSQRGRISLPDQILPWLRRALLLPKISLIPLTPEIAARSESLIMHGDPADRLIAATAIEYDCPLATVDHRLLELSFLKKA